MTIRDDVIDCQCQIPALIELYPRYFPDNAGRRFVEVGAFNGFNWSNTYPLVNLGWAGLMFEPAQEFFEACADRYRDNPLIEVERCAISDECGEVKLFPGGSMTTIEEGLIDVWNKTDWIAQQGIRADKFTMCQAHTLGCRLVAHDFPPDFDLLSIDAEGADYRVLQGLDLTVWHPRMIIVEMDINSAEPIIAGRVKWMQDHLIENGYSMIHSDAINSIFWRDHVG